MPKLDMTETTITIPKYLKEDIKALAKAQSKEKGQHVPMKTYMIDLIAKQKNNRKTIDKQLLAE